MDSHQGKRIEKMNTGISWILRAVNEGGNGGKNATAFDQSP
jgi:hypothetical protein